MKSRWEPAVDEKVTDKVEQIAKGWVNSNIHSNLDLNNKMVSINLSGPQITRLQTHWHTGRTCVPYCYFRALILKLPSSLYVVFPFFWWEVVNFFNNIAEWYAG
jgi:hypothetical protein